MAIPPKKISVNPYDWEKITSADYGHSLMDSVNKGYSSSLMGETQSNSISQMDRTQDMVMRKIFSEVMRELDRERHRPLNSAEPWISVRFRECGEGFLVQWATREGEIYQERFCNTIEEVSAISVRALAEKALK